MEIDWKKKYEEALERARIILCNLGYGDKSISDIETVFPELAESEDERIRAFLYDFIKVCAWSEKQFPPREKCLAYLEKQKEQKPTEPIVNGLTEFEKQVSYLIASVMDKEHKYSEGYVKWVSQSLLEHAKFAMSQQEKQKPAKKQDYSGLTDFERAIHRGFLVAGVENVSVTIIKETAKDCLAQQKQEWSKEEKRQLNRIYAILGQAADTHAYSTSCRLIGDKEAVELQDFLRSIAKPKSGEWSEEDEKMIERLIRHTQKEFDELCNDRYGHQEIISDLKESCRERMNWLENRLKSLRPSWKPSEEQMGALNYAYCELFKREDVDHNILGPLQNLIDTLRKL